MADGQVIYEIKGDNSRFQSDVNETERIAQKKSSAIGKFAKGTIAGIGAAVAAVGAGMISFSKDAIGAGSEFDKAMSQVAATMGVSIDEIQDLTDFAMDMGATTAFSANEAAQALNYMALAGYDAQTSMKMLPNVLSLAAAGGIDLARASDMITDAQSALGLTLPQTNELVDKMAKASSKSNTSVEQLGDAILTVGGTAKNLKGGTTELASVLGVLADNGIKGAEGGTALRNIILALSAPTDTAAKKLDELGVSAYDADGNLRALPDIFDDLNGAMAGMTQGEQTDVLNTIFNKVDLKSANALLGTTRERFDDLSSAIDNASGAAQQMADTQLDNLAGDVTLFKSALEGAKITLSNSLTPALRKFVQFGTKEVGKLDKAFQQGGIEGLADQLGKTLGDSVGILVKKIPDFATAAGKLAFSLLDTVGDTLVTGFPKLLEKGLETAKKLGKGITDRIPDILGGIGSIIGDVIANIPNILELGAEIIFNLGKGIIEGIPKAFQGIKDGFEGMLKKPFSQEVKDTIGELDKLGERINDIGLSSDEMYEKIAGADADHEMAQYWFDVFETLRNKTELTKTEQEKLNSAVEYLNTNVLPETQKIVQDESGKWQANTAAILDNIEAMKQRQYAEIYLEKMRGQMEKMVEIEIELNKQEKELSELEAKKESLVAPLEEVTKKYQDYRKEVDDLLEANENAVFSYEAGSEKMKEYAKSVGITEENFKDWNQVTALMLEQQQEVQREFDSTNNAIDAHNSAIFVLKKSYNMLEDSVDKYADKAAEAQSKAHGVGIAYGNGTAKGIRDSIPEVEKAAYALSNAAIKKMKVTAQIASPSKRARKEIGEQVGKGEALGLEDSIPDVERASEKLINAIDFDVPNMSIPSVSAASSDDSRLSSIIAVLNKYLPRIGAPIILDTGELVGATAEKYDHELGILQQRRARYE